MKTRLWYLFPILFSLAISSMAIPRYYTFEGTVTTSDYDSLNVGSPVSYTFLLDFGVTTVTYIDHGTTYTLATTSTNNYWLAQFISGSIVSVPSGGSFYYDIGSDYLTENRSFVQGSIASTNYNFIQIEIASKKGVDWVVGDQFLGKNDGFYDPGSTTGPRFTVLSNLTLTAINTFSPSCFRGPPGPQGPEGPMGPQGLVGPTGLTGPKGENGEQGSVGPMGPQGEPGQKGDIGPQGLQGFKGDKGDIGPQGSEGPLGPQGLVGQTGPKGDKGDAGVVGPIGPQGLTGIQGPPGTLAELPQGAIMYLISGSPAPSGFTFLGKAKIKVGPSGEDDEQAPKIKVDIYRRN